MTDLLELDQGSIISYAIYQGVSGTISYVFLETVLKKIIHI